MNSEDTSHPWRDASRVAVILYYAMLLGWFFKEDSNKNKGKNAFLRHWGLTEASPKQMYYKDAVINALLILTHQILNILRYSDKDKKFLKEVQKINFRCRYDQATLRCIEERIRMNRVFFELDESHFPRSGTFVYDFLVDGIERYRGKVLIFVNAKSILDMGPIPTKKACKVLLKEGRCDFRNMKIVPSKKIRFNQQYLMDRNILLCY